jgi:hypothetical protein
LSQLLKLSTNIKSKEGERERRPVCFVVVRQSNGQWAGERPTPSSFDTFLNNFKGGKVFEFK